MEIIQHDVRRLDRLISDISDASRLDAELAREDAKPVDMADLLRTTVSLFNDIHRDDTPEVVFEIAYAAGAHPYRVIGHDSRLSQVIVNLLDNAISFSPPGGMPGPSSSTAIWISGPILRAKTATLPPGGEKEIALSRRLTMTWLNRLSWPNTR